MRVSLNGIKISLDKKEIRDLLKAFSPNELLLRYGLEEGGRVQQVIDNAVIRYDIQYVPWATGVLAKSPYIATVIGSGEVVYPGPYAHYMYYGEVYGPNLPVFTDNSGEPEYYYSIKNREKYPTGRPLNYKTDLNPLAGSFWFERMKADHLDDIVDEAKKAVRG